MPLHLYKDHTPILGASVFVAPSADIIGDVTIGDETNIWFNTVIRGDVNYIRIGSRTNIQDGTIVHVTVKKFPTFIGSNVTIGHMAVIHGCTLEDDSFVGMRACIMDGAVVESGGMVAAGALLTPGKRVKSGELWAGAPARLMRPLTQEEKDYITFSAQHYCDLARDYLISNP